MALTQIPFEQSTSEFELVPAGVHPCRCCIIADLGMVDSTQWGIKRKVYIAFELLGTQMQTDNRPFSVGRSMNVSLHEKATLRMSLESWRGKSYSQADIEEMGGQFDIKKLLGVPATLNIMHEEKEGFAGESARTFPVIQGIMPGPKDCPAMVSAPIFFDWDAPDTETVYNTLPEWLIKRMGSDPRKPINTAVPPGTVHAVVPSGPQLARDALEGSSRAATPAPVQPPAPPAADGPSFEDFDDDIPF